MIRRSHTQATRPQPLKRLFLRPPPCFFYPRCNRRIQQNHNPLPHPTLTPVPGTPSIPPFAFLLAWILPEPIPTLAQPPSTPELLPRLPALHTNNPPPTSTQRKYPFALAKPLFAALPPEIPDPPPPTPPLAPPTPPQPVLEVRFAPARATRPTSGPPQETGFGLSWLFGVCGVRAKIADYPIRRNMNAAHTRRGGPLKRGLSRRAGTGEGEF